MRPLGVQVLGLAYRSGEAWNEAAFNNEEFDTLLAKANSIANADERRVVMERIEQNNARRRRCDSAVLAFIISPRKEELGKCRDASNFRNPSTVHWLQ